MSTIIKIDQEEGKQLTRWVDNETPLSAQNMNTILDGIRNRYTKSETDTKISSKANKVSGSNLNNHFVALDTNGNLKDSGKSIDDFGKTSNDLTIKYNINKNGQQEEVTKNFNGSQKVDIDLTGISAGGGGTSLPISANSNTGFQFINNTLQWIDTQELIEDLVIVMDGSTYDIITTFENISHEVMTIEEPIAENNFNPWTISTSENTGLTFKDGVLQWADNTIDEDGQINAIPNLYMMYDGGTAFDILG